MFKLFVNNSDEYFEIKDIAADYILDGNKADGVRITIDTSMNAESIIARLMDLANITITSISVLTMDDEEVFSKEHNMYIDRANETLNEYTPKRELNIELKSL